MWQSKYTPGKDLRQMVTLSSSIGCNSLRHKDISDRQKSTGDQDFQDHSDGLRLASA